MPHMQYPTCLAQGWPMGSGAVESGNKVVVEARLKGAGMHWARANVNPMVALRNAICSERWEEARSQLLSYQHLQMQRTRQLRREQHMAKQETPPASTETPPSDQLVAPNAEIPTPQSVTVADTHMPDAPDSSTSREPWRPGPNHPWRHSPIGKARHPQQTHDSSAKT